MGHKESSDRRNKTRTRCGSLMIGITPIASVPAADFIGPGVPLLDATTIETSHDNPSEPTRFKRLRELASKGMLDIPVDLTLLFLITIALNSFR